MLCLYVQCLSSSPYCQDSRVFWNGLEDQFWLWSGARNIFSPLCRTGACLASREMIMTLMSHSYTPNLRIFPTFYSHFSLWRADYRTLLPYINFLFFFFFRLRFVVKSGNQPLTLHELSVSMSTMLEINNILSHVWFLNLLDTGSHQRLQTAQWYTCSSRRVTQYVVCSRHIRAEFVMWLQDMLFLCCKYVWFVWGNLQEKEEVNKLTLPQAIRKDTISEVNTFKKINL
jgi:hypothetical protein